MLGVRGGADGTLAGPVVGNGLIGRSYSLGRPMSASFAVILTAAREAAMLMAAMAIGWIARGRDDADQR